MTTAAIESLANLIRIRARCLRVVIRLEYGDGNSLSVESKQPAGTACTST